VSRCERDGEDNKRSGEKRVEREGGSSEMTKQGKRKEAHGGRKIDRDARGSSERQGEEEGARGMREERDSG